jgi:S-formylglutathione hydrolase
MSKIETLSEQRCYGGVQGFYRFVSDACGGPMTFGVYTPPQGAHGKVPVLYYLAGLTCTAETFLIKAGAQRIAAELGLLLVARYQPARHGVRGCDWRLGIRRGCGFLS